MKILRLTVMPPIASDKISGTTTVGMYRAYGETEVADIYDVEHTSPYFNQNQEVGFVSLPPAGSQILACQTSDAVGSNRVYYLATITTPQPGARLAQRTDENTPPNLMDKTIGSLGVPQSISLIGPGKHSIEISHDLDTKGIKDTGVYLQTAGGKLISLEDGPKKNNIVVKTGDGLFGQVAAIELQEIPNSTVGGLSTSYTVSIYATGSINMFASKGNVNMRIEDGNQINIENASTGLNGAYPGDPTCGAINIKSQNSSINIIAGPDPVTGFVGTPTPNSISTVNITAAGGPLTTMNLHTDGQLNLSGRQGVRIAGGDLRVGVTGIAPILIDGATINLNTPV